MSTLKKTNAARLLDKLGIAYELQAFAVDENDLSAVAAARALGADPEQVFKTLAVLGDKTGLLLACIPAAADLDLKALAQVSGNKRVVMAPLKDVLALTGYVRGGCSPVGVKKPCPVWLDQHMLDHPRVYVSAGQRGMQFLLCPQDLAKAVNGDFAALTG